MDPIWRKVFAAEALLGLLGLGLAVGVEFMGLSFVLAVLALGLWFLFIVLINEALEFMIYPTFFRRCRSCRRRMRSASVWIRPTWLAEQGGFCEPDCVAALKSGMWEEAVKLLWIHTSDEKSEIRYKLEFFECADCRDQRAYPAMETLKGIWELKDIHEAYRFGMPENAQRFLAKSQSSKQPVPISSESVPAAPAALRNGIDLHNRRTM
jgi:hypothetical protein